MAVATTAKDQEDCKLRPEKLEVKVDATPCFEFNSGETRVKKDYD